MTRPLFHRRYRHAARRRRLAADFRARRRSPPMLQGSAGLRGVGPALRRSLRVHSPFITLVVLYMAAAFSPARRCSA